MTTEHDELRAKRDELLTAVEAERAAAQARVASALRELSVLEGARTTLQREVQRLEETARAFETHATWAADQYAAAQLETERAEAHLAWLKSQNVK